MDFAGLEQRCGLKASGFKIHVLRRKIEKRRICVSSIFLSHKFPENLKASYMTSGKTRFQVFSLVKGFPCSKISPAQHCHLCAASILEYDEHLKIVRCKNGISFYLHSDFETIWMQLIYYRNIDQIQGPEL